MQKPLQIHYKHLESSPSLDALIGQRVEALERFFPNITGCRVVLEVPNRSSEGAKVALGIAVEVEIPSRPMVVVKRGQPRRDAKGDETAFLNKAFDAVERKLRKIGEERKREVKAHESVGETGLVVRLFPEEDYGFVEVANAGQLYFTRAAVAGDAFDRLAVGMLTHVTPSPTDGPMGPQASSIRPLGRDESPSDRSGEPDKD